MLTTFVYKQLKKPFFKRFMVNWRNPLTPDQQKEWEIHQVKSKSNSVIQLWISYIPEAKATIVLGHPMGKEAKGYFLKRGYPERLKSQQYNVVVFDLNGFGESSHGNFNYFSDITAVLQKTKKLTPHIPIGYHGISLGSHYGILSFVEDNPPVDFTILESATSNMKAFWHRFPAAMKTIQLFSFFAPKYAKRIDFLERSKSLKTPQHILFIYSQKDDWTPISIGEKLIKYCSTETSLLILKEAPHAEVTKSSDKEIYWKHILDFYQKNISKLSS
jgi:pimeloyl-ACP methyl ester carboxylesterase